MCRLPLILLLSMAAPVLQGQEEGRFVLTPEMLGADSVSVFDYAGYYCDSTGRLGLREVMQMTDRFEPLGSPARKFGNDFLHWLYFRIDNRGSADTLRGTFFSDDPHCNYWYQIDSRGMTLNKSGTVNRPKGDTRWIPSFMDVKVLPGEEARCFVQLDDRVGRVKRKESVYRLAVLSHQGAEEFLNRLLRERLNTKIFLGLFLGILLFMVLFTGLMFLQSRERVYIQYGLYVGSIFLLFLIRRSYEFNTPFSYIAGWWPYLYPTVTLLNFAAYICFIRTFLDVTPQRYPRLDLTLRVGIWLMAALLLLDLALKFLLPVHIYVRLFEWTRTALFISGGWVIFRVFQVRNTLSRYIIGGTLALIVGAMLVLTTDFIKGRFGIDLESHTLSYAQMGVLAEILVFALGLGYRTRLLREEKLKAEMKALKAQMNPHFIFNSLNAIKDLVQKSRPEEAARYLTQFARLFRGILDQSEKDRIFLEEELHFCRDYLSIEALRFDHSFHFEVESGPGLEDFPVAQLTFQPFLENAIRHGLLPKEGERWVKLTVCDRDGCVVGRVEDNGVGRWHEKVSDSGKPVSFGIRLATERLQRQFPGVQVNITDKFNNFGEGEGTVVEIVFRKEKR